MGVDPRGSRRRALKGVTQGRRDLRHAVRYVGAAVSHQPQLLSTGRAREGRRADPADESGRTVRAGEAVQEARRASRTSCRHSPIKSAAYTRNFYTFLMQQDADFFADPQRISCRHPRHAASWSCSGRSMKRI